jgi:hypothetical protein
MARPDKMSARKSSYRGLICAIRLTGLVGHTRDVQYVEVLALPHIRRRSIKPLSWHVISRDPSAHL